MPYSCAEPAGNLRVEGLVVDASGRGVAGARVWIDGMPVRVATSDRDGRFEISSLVARSYEVRAQAGELIGGPQVVRATAEGEPTVIELCEGPRVVVTVLDAARAPIANASVRVIGTAETGTTDAAGKATLTTHPGHVEVEAAAPGCAARRGTAVAAWAGLPARVSIVLRAGFEVRGRVVDEARMPVANVAVYADSSSCALEPPAAITDEAGAFALPPAVGTHHLVLIDGEHAPQTATVDVDREIRDLEIVMKPGFVYAGRVVDAERRPVAHARVYLDTFSAPGRRWFCAASDADGAFEIRGLPRTLGATAAEANGAVVHVVADAGESELIEVQFARQAQLRGQELAVERIDRDHEIRGVVVDDTGAPVPNVVVHAIEGPIADLSIGALRSRVTPSEGDTRRATSTRADARGAFVMRDLPAGSYGLWPGAFSNRPFLGLETRFLVGVDVSPAITTARAGDTDVRVTMARAARITGKVALAETGEPVDDFEVDVFGAAEMATSVPGGAGAFDLRAVRPGSYRLQIRAPGFRTVWKTDVEVGPGQHVDAGTIALERGTTITGTVVDAAGHPVAGASVIVGELGIFGAAGRFDAALDPSHAVTDASGAFAIAGISTAASRLVLAADHPTRGRSAAIAITPRDSTRLVLRECGALAGRLTRNGLPLARAGISVGWPPYGNTVVNADGEFVLARLPAGDVALRINVFADGLSRVHEATARVVAGARTVAVFEVPEGTIKLSVVVAPEPGAHVAGARIHLFRGTVTLEHYAAVLARLLRDAHEWQDWTGGVMPAFERLVPGDYTVCVMPLAGSPHDSVLMQRVSRNRTAVKVYCRPVRVDASPAEQALTVEVPAMAPLPQL